MQRVGLLSGIVLAPFWIPASAGTAAVQTLRGSRASVDRIHRQALDHRLEFYDTFAAVRKGARNHHGMTHVRDRRSAPTELA